MIVLCFMKEVFIDTEDMETFKEGGAFYPYVTHWMPLPSPPNAQASDTTMISNDVKLENMLIKNNSVKLCDFGLSRAMAPKNDLDKIT